MCLATFKTVGLAAIIALTSACSHMPAPTATNEPEILTISHDGTMRLMGRLIPTEDVFIYPDGFGGEKAAVKVWFDPLHPPFYRDSIIVRRLDGTLVSDNN